MFPGMLSSCRGPSPGPEVPLLKRKRIKTWFCRCYLNRALPLRPTSQFLLNESELTGNVSHFIRRYLADASLTPNPRTSFGARVPSAA